MAREFASRIDYLRDEFVGKKKKKGLFDITDRIFNKIISVDPTRNKIYSQWMLRMYSKHPIRAEDIYKMGQDLALYHKFKRSMPANMRDINRIGSPRELLDLVTPYAERRTKREEDREERDAVRREITVVYDGPHGKVLIPKSERASCYLGRGTRWCTAATRSDNAFKEYNKEGPLYVLITRDGEKYQFHLPTGCLTDKNDEQQYNSTKGFRQRHRGLWGELQKAIPEKEKIAAIRKDGNLLSLIVEPSERVQLEAVKGHPYTIAEITNPSERVQLEAMKRSLHSISLIRNPSKGAMLYAVNRAPEIVHILENPPDAVKHAADHPKRPISPSSQRAVLMDAEALLDSRYTGAYPKIGPPTDQLRKKASQFVEKYWRRDA